MVFQGQTKPKGKLGLKVIRKNPSIWNIIQGINPLSKDSEGIRLWKLRNLWNINRGFWKICIAKTFGIRTVYGALYLKKIAANREITDYGLVAVRVVTNAGVELIVDAFQNTVELKSFKYHALGTGSTAEAVGDTALVTELTTEYASNVRATGTTTEGATGNIYKTVATNTMDEAPSTAIREHGILIQAATGGGTLLDRTVFSAINLASGDGLQSEYQLTFTAGS
jgi:hypothetical protein